MILTLPKKFFNLKKDGVTQSMLMEFAACRRKMQLAYQEGWTSEYSSNALTFGSMFHGCLEYLYNRQQFFLEENKVDEYIKAAIKFVSSQHREATTNLRHWTIEDEDSLELNKGYLYILLPKYFKRYWHQDRDKKVLKNEELFKNSWQNRIVFTGKFDRVFKNTHNEMWLYETKTKSRIEASLQDRLSFDFQANFYILNLLLSTGVFAKGFVYDVIRRPEHRMGKNEALPGFIKRVRKAVTPDYFQRITVTRTRQEFDEWVAKDLTPIVNEFLDWYKGVLPTYRNPSACETRYGACKFIKICGMNNYHGLYKRKILFPELVEGA